ncbi:MAG TPA: metallophosphoesterase [Clostridia bacterium]|nr:metallophosphoesterase [Clostridia bacterium]
MKKAVKKWVSIILCISVLFSLLSFDMVCAKSKNRLSVLVATDLHLHAKSLVNNIQNFITMPEKPIYKHARFNGQLYAESEAILARFLSIAAQSDEEYILIPGDISDMGRVGSHYRAAEMLNEFEAQTNKKIYVINGNHDAQKEFTKSDFEELYGEFGFEDALYRHEDSLSYTVDLDDNYRLLAIDSCVYNHSYGIIDDSLLSWIENQVALAQNDSKYLIAIMHHNLLKHMKGLAIEATDKIIDDRIENADDVWPKFADWGIKYIFTGHAHANDIAMHVSARGNEIYDIETCALIGYPCSYRKVEFSDSSVKVETRFIDSIDTSFLPGGYSAQQLELINNNFQEYAYGMLGASAEHMLKHYMLTPSGIDKLKIDPDSSIAKLLEKIMPDMYEILCLPLYKDSSNDISIEEIALDYGYNLPESNYYDIFEVAGYIVGQHTMGDENIAADSVEMELMWNCIMLAASESLKDLEEDFQSSIKIFGTAFEHSAVRGVASNIVFRQGAAKEIATIIFGPVIEGLTCDAYEPSDLNVSLPSYIHNDTLLDAIVYKTKIICFELMNILAKIIKLY